MVKSIINEMLEMTYPDDYYKNVIEPAKLGKGPVPSMGQMMMKSQPFKAVSLPFQEMINPGKYGSFRSSGTPAARAITGPLSTAARTLFSAPAAGIIAALTPTDANADEANMTIEDFAALNQGVTPNNESIMVEDLTNPNTGNFLISAANALPNQSGTINARPNIMDPGVTTITNQAPVRDFNMRDIAGDEIVVNEDLIDRGNPTGDPRIVSEELGSVGFARPTMADVAGASLPLGAPSQYDQSAIDGYQDLIMNPDYMPNRLQNLERFADNRFEDEEFMPGFDFVDAPNKVSNLRELFMNRNYLNNPRTGFIDKTLLARGNPNAGLVARTGRGIGSLLSRIPTPFNLVRRGLDSITGPRRETTGMVYDDRGRGYTPEELNKMNAKGGYYSEPAREQRRREKRVENLLARKAAGKSYSQKNLNKLTTGGSKPGTYTVKGAGSAGSSGGGKSIVCTAMYQTTGLQDWKKAMKIWYIYQKKHLTDTHQEGYHWLFKPFVKAMKKSKIVEALGAHVAKHRTQELKHVLFNSKSDKLGKVYNMILEPICFIAGKIKSALGRG